jgi:bifunctional non-homologous end joining protein LigD
LSSVTVKRTKTRSIEGATPAAMPGFIKPQLATLKSKAPKAPQWLHEIKFDRYRVQVPEQRKEEGLHAQRVGLDQTVSPSLPAPFSG